MSGRARDRRQSPATPLTESVAATASMVTTALDDPVPPGSTVAPIAANYCETPPHRLEAHVQRELLAHPQLHFSSLVVRRVGEGVCLEGLVETSRDAPDVAELVRELTGVEQVINHLLVHDVPAPCKAR